MTTEWNADTLMEFGAAFLKPRILLSAAELDIFTQLEDRPQTGAQLCAAHGWDERGLRILMDALTAMGLLEKSPEGVYSVPVGLVGVLSSRGTKSILPMIRHRARMWESWSHLTFIVRTGDNPNPMRIGERTDEEMESFIGAMHVIGRKMAQSIAASLDLSRFSHLLDIGGASGSYTIAFLQQSPQLKATLFDLPQVVEMARERLTEEGFIDRVTLVAGDYHEVALPTGHDLALLSAIIHSNSREQNRDLYRKTYDALVHGGTILIRDHIMDDSRTQPPEGAVFAVNMLTATRGGDCYTLQETREDLEAAGFTNVRMLRDGPRMDQLVAADKA